jgi:predicted acyltransferase
LTQSFEGQNQTKLTTRFLAGRLVSLDVFRGIAIAFMILINNLGGDTNYPILLHADWNGLTLADVFFPFFLFIVGAAIPYSLGRKLENNESKKSIFLRIIRRAIILFALGVFINGFPYFNLSTLRVMGVLQRIALCYLITSIIYLTLNRRKQISITVLFMVVYWMLMTLVPVPGYGPGVLERQGNLAAYVDNLVLGPGHLWGSLGTWDPEGLLSTIPAIATTMLGLLAGEHLRTNRTPKYKSTALLVLGAFLIAVGALWNLVFPINKSLWTSSFVALTGGLAFIVLDFCYYIFDFKKYVSWAKPLIIFGLNSIVAYVSTEIINLTLMYANVTLSDGTYLSLKSLIYEQLFASWAGPLNGSLLYGVAFLLFWLGIMAILYKQRIFIRV